MEKILILILLILQGFSMLSAQSIEPTGKPITEIFTNFHYYFNDTINTTGFGIERALLGYKFLPVNNFSATVVVNIGSPEDLAAGSEPKRYAYFREAFMSYSIDKMTLNMGMIKTRMNEYQQHFLGKRYVANTLQSLNEFGYVSDIGISIDYKFNDFIKADFNIMNGKGYSNIQFDNNVKVSTGFYITPTKEVAFRVFEDITKREGLWQSTTIIFAGINNDLITLGGDFSYKSNLDLIGGHHAWGISGTGVIRFSEKTELFGRFDHFSSIIPTGETMQWNYLNDYNFLISGIQYSFSENIKFALNYQGTYPYSSEIQKTNALYMNVLFKFE